ncbi:HPP family protein [Halalkalibacter krulwichiae]|uniref:HPP family protein n=1 Tax=Halalkalibacter krulwichiae TaxID=199441 RepID=A0A1X9MBS2_9BACI|nr:HPP family protein [Halalkalibacter krulwichiae]ARK29603.1 HPP family protein [Halalkalibacter krulwichiae]
MPEKELRKTADVNSSFRFSTYISKMKGEAKENTALHMSESLISAGGSLIAMTIISLLAVTLGYPMALGPVGASCLLVFVAHSSPFSQPRQVIGGHVISTFAALLIWDIFGRTHLTIGVTIAVVILLMLLSNTMHPPAAASAIVALNSGVGWGIFLTIALSACLVVLSSVAYNNLFHNRHYPKRWL